MVQAGEEGLFEKRRALIDALLAMYGLRPGMARVKIDERLAQALVLSRAWDEYDLAVVVQFHRMEREAPRQLDS
jgi:hypothetical protein